MNTENVPTDVWYEIFFRLPSLEPVFKFRCVSKLWNSLLSEPSFISKMFNTLTSIPWIFMYDPKYYPSYRQVQLYLKRNQKFINHHDGLSFKFLSDALPFKPRGLREEVCLLDSCSNGLVLYSTYPLDRGYSAIWNCRNTKFYICNPLTKQRVSLPPRPYTPPEITDPEETCESHTKLVCESSLGQCICNYKVVCVYSYEWVYNSLQIFSSETGEWKTFPWPKEIWGLDIPYNFYELLIRDGVLYWTYWTVDGPDEYILAGFNTLGNTENVNDRCKSIVFPTRLGDHEYHSFFGESEGSIYYGCIDDGQKAFLSLWLLEDDFSNGGLNWKMVDENIELTGYTPSEMKYFYLNPVDRNVIIIVERGCCLAYNFRTRKHKFLLGFPVPKIRKCIRTRKQFFITPKPTVIPLFK